MSSKPIRVLIQVRPDAFSVPGADTLIATKLKQGLGQFGVTANVSSNMCSSPQDHDLVQIFDLNSADARLFSQTALARGIPYVLTPLYYPARRYLRQSVELAVLFEKYASSRDNVAFQTQLRDLKKLPEVVPSGLGETVQHASCLVACGEREADLLRGNFPNIKAVEVIPVGLDHVSSSIGVSRESFVDAYGVKDFVLCVGKLSSRNNQLMLLYALQFERVPIVFANTRGPENYYDKLCRGFLRVGKNYFVGRLSAEMLASARAATAVVVQPSFYETPGLVPLECAKLGIKGITSAEGTAAEYLGDRIRYSDPFDPTALRDLIIESLETRKTAPALDYPYTWEDHCRRMAEIYRRVVEQKQDTPWVSVSGARNTELEKDTPLCSIVIPVKNKIDYTTKCLNTLRRNTADVSHEIVVVDDGSSDITPEVLARREDVRLVRNEVNLGFAKACNRGAEAAHGKYLVFLNNDTEPQIGWLSEMVKMMEEDAAVGVVGSKLIFPNGFIQHAGCAIHENRHPVYLHRMAEPFVPQVNKKREFPVVTGACLMIRRELFQKLGGFNELYINGCEDIELCLAVRSLGHKVMYCPTSVVVHLEHGTDGVQAHSMYIEHIVEQRWASKIAPNVLNYYREDGLQLQVDESGKFEWKAVKQG